MSEAQELFPAPRFFNRELSWVEFNARILAEARRNLPALEKLRFLEIVADNFDDFFMVRVAGLKRLALSAPDSRDAALLTPAEQLSRIARRAHEIHAERAQCLNAELLPLLAQNGLVYTPPEQYTRFQREFLAEFFDAEVFPLLTPLRLENNAFPRIANLTLHAAFLLKNIQGIEPPAALRPAGDAPFAALVQVPQVPGRVVWLPEENGVSAFALLDDVITLFGTRLFPGYSVEETMLFSLTRDADFPVDEESDDFIRAMEEILEKRKVSFPVRLVCNDTSAALAGLFKEALSLSDDDVYRSHGVIDAASLSGLRSWKPRGGKKTALTYPAWRHYRHPDFSGDEPWDTLKIKDALLQTPYQSYDPVVRLVTSAAADSRTLSIKITLYRTSGASPIIGALEKAARSNKQVTVFVELKARFDEAQNITWVERLEQAGVIVVWGVVNLKVHAKALLIIRKEETGIRRYVHLSTGNYNEETARVYSDLSIFTANNEIAGDVTLFFNILSGYSALQTMKRLSLSPAGLKEKFLSMIEREISSSTPENPGLIIAKMNSLSHVEIIEALYRASQAGVRVRLNVRGICMLVPGVAGLSENIEVVSIIDRYLEHSRVYYFWNGGAEELYLSSADLMPRNLERRIELLFPVLQPDVFQRIKELLDIYFADTAKSYRLMSDGSWQARRAPQGEENRAQEILHRRYKALSRAEDEGAAMFVVRRHYRG